MTIRELYIKKFGDKRFNKLPPRVREVVKQIDALPTVPAPISARQLQEALR